MPRKCTICEHEQVEAINQELIRGMSYRKISQKFSLSYDALYRHREHIPAEIAKAQQIDEAARADSLFFQVKELQAKAWELLNKAEAAGELKTALIGVREAKGCLELLAKVQGELDQEGAVNIILAPEWLKLRAVILQTLAPYPEAKNKLTNALRGVENAAE